jgi:DNA-binding MarR family transcriptional regulator
MQNDCNSVPSKNDPSSIIKKLKRLTSGGRSLNAIHLNKNLNQIETHLMLVLAGLLDFRGLDEECSFGDAKLTIAMQQIANRMKMTIKGCRPHLSKLCEKGYVTKTHNFSADDKRQLESTFMLTDQIFVEYAEELGLDLDAMSSCGGGTIFPGGGNNIPYNLHNSLFNDPPSEKKKNKKPKKPCVGRSPSLRQKDTHNFDKNLDDSFVPEIEDKTPLEEGLQGVQSPKTAKPIVTPAHNKMVLLFTPRPELKSYVHRNTILALTDDLIAKHGKMAVKAINRLYDDLIAEDLCGKFEWSVKRTLSFFNEAMEKLKSES